MKINMLTLDDDALEEIPLSSYPKFGSLITLFAKTKKFF